MKYSGILENILNYSQCAPCYLTYSKPVALKVTLIIWKSCVMPRDPDVATAKKTV